MNKKIIFYSTDCPKCKVLKLKLDNLNLAYEVCNDVDLMLSKGFLSVPLLEVDGDIMDFTTAIQWVSAIE